MTEIELLAAIACLLATQNGMSCDAGTLKGQAACLWPCMSRDELLASIAYTLCNGGGGGGGGGGLTFTSAAGIPPVDGSVTTQGYINTSSGAKYINVAWPSTASPNWQAF